MGTNSDEISSTLLTGMQIQLGRIEGTLNTIVTEHARRIADTEVNQRQLRTDLDAVKNEAAKQTNDLSTRLVEKIAAVDTKANTNTNNISAITTDVQEVKDKQNGSWQKVWTVLAFVVAGVSAAWNILGGKT